jgi:hypothetical protein
MGFGLIFLVSWIVLATFAFYKKQSVIISILGTFIVALVFTGIIAKKDPPRETYPEQAVNQELMADSEAAKIRAKEFVEATLKSPTTASWASYNDFATAQAQDKKGRVIKDLWQVTGYVDAQNSYGAKLRNNFLVTLRKASPEWQLVKLSTY